MRGHTCCCASNPPQPRRSEVVDELGGRCYDDRMSSLKARVRNGRLVLDEATDLPEGTEVDLVPADWWDDLDDEDREKLERSLETSEGDVQAGRMIQASVILDRLRREA